MITYNSRVITYLAFALLGYFAFQKYSEYKAEPKYLKQKGAVVNSLGGAKPKYTMKIDPAKKYEDYSLVEKFAYRFVKEDLPQELRKQIESPTTTKKTDKE
jgi:hypothetical protein